MSLDLVSLLPAPWQAVLAPHLDAERTRKLGEFVAGEYASQTVYPPVEDLFTAYRLCRRSGCACCCSARTRTSRPARHTA